jgi:hypothetical protein
MSNESAMRDLFDRWERVWHEGQYDLIPSCVGPTYIRHDEKGDRTAAEIAQTRQQGPNFRFVVYDHSGEPAASQVRLCVVFRGSENFLFAPRENTDSRCPPDIGGATSKPDF